MLVFQPWLFFALVAAFGLLGYNLSIKSSSEQLPPIVFATVMYVSGTAFLIPIFAYYIKDKPLSLLLSFSTKGILYAVLAGASVVITDIAISAMYNKGAPLGLGMMLVQSVALSLTFVAGVMFFGERHSLINIAGIFMAFISVPLMLYQAK